MYEKILANESPSNEGTSCVTSSDDDDEELEAAEAYDTFEEQPVTAPVTRQPTKLLRRQSTRKTVKQGM